MTHGDDVELVKFVKGATMIQQFGVGEPLVNFLSEVRCGVYIPIQVMLSAGEGVRHLPKISPIVVTIIVITMIVETIIVITMHVKRYNDDMVIVITVITYVD